MAFTSFSPIVCWWGRTRLNSPTPIFFLWGQPECLGLSVTDQSFPVVEYPHRTYVRTSQHREILLVRGWVFQDPDVSASSCHSPHHTSSTSYPRSLCPPNHMPLRLNTSPLPTEPTLHPQLSTTYVILSVILTGHRSGMETVFPSQGNFQEM